MKKCVRVLCLSVCLSLCFSLFLCNTFTASAGTDWNSMSEEAKGVVKELWGYLVTNGYSEVSAAAVLGNCNQESNFNGKANCDEDGTPTGSYAGAFQISKDRWNNTDENNYRWWIEKKLGKYWNACWYDITVQIQFVEYSCTEGYRSWETYIASADVDLDTYAEFKSYGKDVTEGNIDDMINKATGAFCAGFEGCIASGPVQSTDDNSYNGKLWQQLGNRRAYAQEIYNALKGTVAMSSNGSEAGSESIKKFVSSWLKDEYNDEWGIYERITTTLIDLPDGSDLGVNEKSQLQAWKEIIETEDEFSVISFLRTCVAFVGILLVIYSTLVYLAYWVDRVNNFVAFSFLNALTMGRLMISPDDNSSTFTSSNKKVKAVVHRDIIFVSLLGIAIGVILLSGRIYLIIEFFIEFAKDVLG